uniref:Uncharacterized protein LOC114340260 n=1 Tax=Diabrotica virgifera virgifera TaxID=50390 RepID=A0A6P7GBX4_DIAVI
MWFMHDGAPVHFCRTARQHLDVTYPNRWIGRGGPQHWPPRSPELNPCDFCFWGYLKSLVYTTPIVDINDLKNCIQIACDTIRNTPQIVERVRLGKQEERRHRRRQGQKMEREPPKPFPNGTGGRTSRLIPPNTTSPREVMQEAVPRGLLQVHKGH